MFKNWRLFNLFLGITVMSCLVACQENQPKKAIIAQEIAATKDKVFSETTAIETIEIPNVIDKFVPNPALEAYLELPILGKDFVVKLEYPNKEIRHPLKNNQFMFRIKGEIIPKSEALPTGFKLRLFSNSTKDFKADKSMDEWDIIFKDEENPFAFKVSNIINVQAGIYYYTIEETESKERFYVGKISLL